MPQYIVRIAEVEIDSIFDDFDIYFDAVGV